MPAVPSCILDPFRTQFLALLPERVVVHPLGCHRPRIDDTVVFDKLIGLDLHNLPLDGCTTKAPSGGDCAGPSPVDRAKAGAKRSQVADGYGIPLGTVAAPANRPDHTLLDATLDTLALIGPLPDDARLHMDAGSADVGRLPRSLEVPWLHH